MTHTLSKIADRLQLPWEGEDVAVERPSLLGDARPGSLALATTAHYAEAAAAKGASALIAPPGVQTGLPVLRSDRVRLDFARVLALFDERHQPAPGIHPTAVIAEGAKVDSTASVGPHAVIEEGACVGPRTIIGANVCIGHGSRIGADGLLGPGVVIYHRCTLGDRVRIQAGTAVGTDGFGYEWDGARHVPVPHVGTVIIEDDVEIGANTSVDRAKTGETRIGRGTRIDNLVQVGHGVHIGPNCLLVAQVGTAGSVSIETGAVLAGQVGVADNVTIGPGAIISAQSGVSGDVPGGKVYMGFPLREATESRRIYAAESRLPALLRRVRDLERRLARMEGE